MSLSKETNETVYNVIGACMEVHRSLGPGLSVDFYKKALEIEFIAKKMTVDINKAVEVNFKETSLGTYELDFILNNDVIVEVKSQDELKDSEIQHTLRSLGLAKATMGILVNFGGTKIQYRRILPSRQGNNNQNQQSQPSNIKNEVSRPLGYRNVVSRTRTREGNPAI